MSNQYRSERHSLRRRIAVLEEDRDALTREKQQLEQHLAELEPPGPPPPSEPAVAEIELRTISTPRWSLGEWLSDTVCGWSLYLGPLLGIIGIAAPVVLGIGMALHDCSIDQHGSLTWSAQVVSADDGTAEGTPCTVRADVRTNGDDAYRIKQLTVRCDGELKYDSHAPISALRGKNAPSPDQACDQLKLSASDDGYRYTIRCHDLEGRAGGRPEMSLDSQSGQLVIWRDVPPTLKLKLSVDKHSAASQQQLLR